LDPVVKPFGITVKKEAGNVVETSGEKYVIKPHATNCLGAKGLYSPFSKLICGMGLNYILLSRRFDYLSFLLHGNAKGLNYWVQNPCPSIAGLILLPSRATSPFPLHSLSIVSHSVHRSALGWFTQAVWVASSRQSGTIVLHYRPVVHGNGLPCL